MTDSTDDLDWYDESLKEYNCWEEQRLTSNTHWMLKDKTIVKIIDMSTSHIKNSMEMLERINWNRVPAYKGLETEYIKRNE